MPTGGRDDHRRRTHEPPRQDGKREDEPRDEPEAPDPTEAVPGWPGNPKDEHKRASGLPTTPGHLRRAAERK